MNRCTSYPCGFDLVCQSGKCYNSVCLNQNQVKPTCNATTLYSLFNESDFTTSYVSSFARCEASNCSVDQYCQSSKCYNATCLSSTQEKPACNASTRY